MLKPVKLLDALFLHAETRETPMHVGALFVLERRPRQRADLTQRLRKLVAGRLGASEVFTRRLTTLPLSIANPMWTTADQVDLEHHIRRSDLPAPGTWQQLENRVAHLHEALLDRSRPLWELHVIEGLEDGRPALYVKTHHAGLDGHSAQLFLAALVDPSPRPRAVHSAPPPGPGARRLSVIAASTRHQLEQLIRLPARASELVSAAAGLLRGRDGGSGATPRTVFNDVVTARRSFGTCELPLDTAKAVAGATGATLNDVVLAAVSGAVRRWLLDHGLLPGQPLLPAYRCRCARPAIRTTAIQVAFISVNLTPTPRARAPVSRRSARPRRISPRTRPA